jgi:hypothetical protein
MVDRDRPVEKLDILQALEYIDRKEREMPKGPDRIISLDPEDFHPKIAYYSPSGTIVLPHDPERAHIVLAHELGHRESARRGGPLKDAIEEEERAWWYAAKWLRRSKEWTPENMVYAA